MHDQTEGGRPLKWFPVMDEYCRENLALEVGRGMKGADVVEVLDRLVEERGAPEYIRSDNGPEFIAQKVQKWLKDNAIKTIYIDSGSPWQNGYIERFHSRFRDECLDREVLLNLREARVVIEDWRQHYNQERPHSRLGYRSPEAFIEAERNAILSHKVDQF